MESFSIFLAGMALGLGIILPFGPLNLFLMGQGFQLGMPRALPAVVLVGLNNSVMIGAAVVLGSIAAATVSGIRTPLLLIGGGYLAWLGFRMLRAAAGSTPASTTMDALPGDPISLWRTAAISCAVVWLNPHAILDAFGALGSAIVLRRADHQMPFGIGVIAACWLWYFVLAAGAGWLRSRVTPFVARWFDGGSGVLMLVFSARFLLEAVE